MKKQLLPPVVELSLYLWPSTNELWMEKMAAAVHRHRTCGESRGDIFSARVFITALLKAGPVPLQWRGPSLRWRLLFQRLVHFGSQLTKLLLPRRSVSIHSGVAVLEGLPVG